MSKYITKFSTENDYLNALDGLDYPNVSLIGQTCEVKYLNESPIPPYKFKAFWNGVLRLEIACNGNTELTQNEVNSYNNISYCQKIEIGDCVTTIGNSALTMCGNVTAITIPDSITVIGKNAFGQRNAALQKVTNIYIPSGVTSIGEGAFWNCSGLTSLDFPSSVTSLEKEVLFQCKSLQSFTIKNTVTSIGEGAFVGCYGLTSITIPNSVTSIGNYAFKSCNSLNSVTVLGTTPPNMNNYGEQFLNTNCPIYVPSESVNTYKAANGWKQYADRIQAIP